jgi:hypothetical protein
LRTRAARAGWTLNSPVEYSSTRPLTNNSMLVLAI